MYTQDQIKETEHRVADGFSNVEMFDVRVALLLIHPNDLEKLKASEGFKAARRETLRPEWGSSARCVGTMWNVTVVVTEDALPADPSVLPGASDVFYVWQKLIAESAKSPVIANPPRIRDLMKTRLRGYIKRLTHIF
jgi:hypothetical protein